ncbi:hypothetical protein T07_6488 [Trichinella nelsoni]|uniref:Uncharacterized protein n=1 Tax=Trichinella nelsoni TaxID=6336 RepID=A0A0V0S6W7_9BILA|nr:hypothetical protein T07_6488 [Trichinella nelsoni]
MESKPILHSIALRVVHFVRVHKPANEPTVEYEQVDVSTANSKTVRGRFSCSITLYSLGSFLTTDRRIDRQRSSSCLILQLLMKLLESPHQPQWSGRLYRQCENNKTATSYGKLNVHVC